MADEEADKEMGEDPVPTEEDRRAAEVAAAGASGRVADPAPAATAAAAPQPPAGAAAPTPKAAAAPASGEGQPGWAAASEAVYPPAAGKRRRRATFLTPDAATAALGASGAAAAAATKVDIEISDSDSDTRRDLDSAVRSGKEAERRMAAAETVTSAVSRHLYESTFRIQAAARCTPRELHSQIGGPLLRALENENWVGFTSTTRVAVVVRTKVPLQLREMQARVNAVASRTVQKALRVLYEDAPSVAMANLPVKSFFTVLRRQAEGRGHQLQAITTQFAREAEGATSICYSGSPIVSFDIEFKGATVYMKAEKELELGTFKARTIDILDGMDGDCRHPFVIKWVTGAPQVAVAWGRAGGNKGKGKNDYQKGGKDGGFQQKGSRGKDFGYQQKGKGGQMVNMQGQQMQNMRGQQMPNMQGVVHQMPDMQGLEMQMQNMQGLGSPMPNMQGSPMPNMQGSLMPNMQGSQMPNMQGSQMPNLQMPNMQGSQMPNMQGQIAQMPNMQGLDSRMPNMQGQNSQMPNMQVQSSQMPNMQAQSSQMPNMLNL